MRINRLAFLMMGVGALALASPLALRGVDQWQQARYAARDPHPQVQRISSHHTGLLAAPVLPEPATGRVVGKLVIPDLQLTTTVIQGTSDTQLLLAPGHLPRSVLPGEPGLSVIAAHNATYFHQINQLKLGDLIRVTTAQGVFTFRVTSHTIVGENQGLPDSTASTLALEACYPLDALYFTPTRYVVFAKLVDSQLTKESLTHAVEPAVWPYHANIPSFISNHYPLWLSQNSLPMGTLRYRGVSGYRLASFVHGPSPLNITAEAIRLLEAYRYTSQHTQLSWLQAILSTATSTGDPFWGASSVSFSAPVRLTLTIATAGQPTGLTLLAPNVTINDRAHVLSVSYRIVRHRISLIRVTSY